MKAALNRTLIDKSGAVILFLLVLLFFGKDFGGYGLAGKSIWVVVCAALLINAVFILSTPVAKISNSKIYLYSEVQPIVFSLKPQIVDLNDLNNLEIGKGFIEFRAIFYLSHGGKIFHGFPVTSDKNVIRFVKFLFENTESEAIKTAYNKLTEQTPKNGTA